MSFDTYISIIVGDVILGGIFSIILYLIDIHNNKIGKKKKGHYKKVIISIVIVAIVLTLIFGYSSRKATEKNFETLVQRGKFEYSNKNFIRAADWFDQALAASYSIKSECYAMFMKYNCYMLNGISIEKGEHVDVYLLNMARNICESIIDTPKYKSLEYYQCAMIDIGIIYYFLDVEYTNAKWVSSVDYIENHFIFDELVSLDINDFELWLSASMSICYYYKTALFSCFPSLLDNHGISSDTFFEIKEYQDKSLYYLTSTAGLLKSYDEVIDINMYKDTYCYIVSNLTSNIVSDALIKSYKTIDDKDFARSWIEDELLNNSEYNRFELTRAICKDALEYLDIYDDGQYDIYLQIRRNIGKAYYMESMITDNQLLRFMAYEEFMSLVHLTNIQNDDILNSAGYAILTNCCDESDIQEILTICQTVLQNLSQGTDINELVHATSTTLLICEMILSDYDADCIEAIDLGKKVYSDMNTVFFELLDDGDISILNGNGTFFE